MALNLTRKPIGYETKVLPSNKNNGNNGTLPDLTINGLVIGQFYLLSMTCTFSFTASTLRSCRLEAKQGATSVAVNSFQNASAVAQNAQMSVVNGFIATATSLTFNLVSFDAGSVLSGNGTRDLGTYVELFGPMDVAPSTALT